jgi:hypothetical protein
MDRSVSVNVQSDSDPSEFDPGFPPGDLPPDQPDDSSGKSDLGPCLYFGPAGQRCDRRAVEGGFCSRHQPGAIREGLRTQLPRRTLAVVGVLAVLWPVLADLVRELIRFFR